MGKRMLYSRQGLSEHVWSSGPRQQSRQQCMVEYLFHAVLSGYLTEGGRIEDFTFTMRPPEDHEIGMAVVAEIRGTN